MGKQVSKRQQEMYSIIKKWKQSSLTLKEYSENHGFNYSMMKYWHKKHTIHLRESKRDNTKKESNFIPVEVSDPISKSSISKSVPIEIHYPNGVFLQCPSHMCIKELKNLITLF